MKVILLKDVSKVGSRHDVREVSAGFARNNLIPRGVAILADKRALHRLEEMKKKENIEKALKHELLEKEMKSLDKARITLSAKGNKEGGLFRGIHREEIVELLRDTKRVSIPLETIKIKEPIKIVGVHSIPIEIDDQRISIELEIVPKG